MTTRTDVSVLETKQLSFMEFLHYPDLLIPEKKITAITGESGTGKSTLLRLLNNSVSPSTGLIRYRGSDTQDIDPVQLRRNILLAGQSVFLFDDTISGNFRQFYAYRDEPVPDKTLMTECLSVCQAKFPLDSSCKNLSGGERQRVFLALFLSMHSDVLLLDEPTSALDATTGKKVMNTISEFCRDRGRTLIVVSHDQVLVDQFAENRVLLSRTEGV